MRNSIIVILATLIAGCATQPIPMPVPAPACDYKVAGKCKTNTASDISGATTLGHSNDEDLPAKAAAVKH